MKIAIWFALTACACSQPDSSPSPAPANAESDAGAPVPEPNELADAVTALLAEAASTDAFSGSAAVIDNGKVVLEKGFGLANRKEMRENTPDTVFRIASMSKQFTATAVLALQVEGKLSVTDPVSKFFPDYPKENLARDGVQVTLHHLLSHTSGLPDPMGTKALLDAAWSREIAPTEQVDAAKVLPLRAVPGASYAYLNYNFLLAALIVERVSGQSFEAFLKDRLFAKAQMTDSGTELPANQKARAATGYYRLASGKFAALQETPGFNDPNATLVFGSGQAYSTVRDLIKWDRALTDASILPEATRELLFKKNLSSYGYGWIMERKGGIDLQWHNGALTPLGFSSLMVRVPAKDRFIVVLSNMERKTTEPLEGKLIDLGYL